MTKTPNSVLGFQTGRRACRPRWGYAAIAVVLGTALLLGTTDGSATSQSDASDVFTEAEAAKLLRQITQGLEGHSARQMLGAFDLGRMEGGQDFKEQVTAFFNQYESIRVHFKLIDVKDAVVAVDAELDSTPANSADPPQHKSTQLRLTAARTSVGWRFIEVQPRSFFS